ITIAITVYDRRHFVKQAIASALNQTIPVRVMVVEDCGPDPDLQTFIKEEFGSKIEYFRNSRRRGLFGNWNACIEYCRTPWLSILHDDDYLESTFVEAMLNLSVNAPDCGLFFGYTVVVDESGKPVPKWQYPVITPEWKPVELGDFLMTNPFPFPGHLFRVDHAKKVGGFRETSLYSGDWEFWVKMVEQCKVAQTRAAVAAFRHHGEWERGTNKILRSGKPFALYAVQRKRNMAALRKRGESIRFDRKAVLACFGMPSRYLIRFAAYFPPRLLSYNVELLLLSKAPHWKYRLFQIFVRLLGKDFIRLSSECWNLFQRLTRGKPASF
ncbi:MAG TPA: glycosyltransferase family 2 protein, partial [Pirellula sp.]|nr:glycosyltransferase family 2 protein [Pirellula sp.]